MNLPNKLSIIRVALIPVIVVLLYQQSDACRIIAGALFIIASLTDFLDGYIARKFGQTTKLGKYLDPLADKLTLFSVGFCVALIYPRLKLFVALAALKDAAMIVCSVILIRRAIDPPAAKWFGKAFTACFYLASVSAVAVYYLSAKQLFIVYLLFSVSFILMITAAVGYCKIFKDLLNKC